MDRFKRSGRRHRHLAVESLEQRQLCVASLSIATSINGLDAGTPPGPSLQSDETADVVYRVTNTGDVPLEGIGVLHDGGTPGNPNDDFWPNPQLTTPIAPGAHVKTFAGLNAMKLLEHPTLPYVYATVMSTHSVAFINTETLTVEANLPLGDGTGPLGMALSNDGTRLYVGMVFSSRIAVFDTTTRTELPSIMLGAPVADVEVGSDGRLFALSPSGILQLDPVSGAPVGPTIAHPMINGMTIQGGVLAISEDKTALYYGDNGLSPSSIYKLNVTNPLAPSLIWESPHGPASNGRDIELTRDGNFFSFVSVIGATNEYAIAKQRTSDKSIEGRFVTGAFPEEIVYSPNGAFAYTASGPPNGSNSKAVVWNANTFTQVGEIAMPGVPHEMLIPGAGRYLFASVDSEPGTDSLYVYETGRAGNRNIGDLNENNQLDPGETWTFSHQMLVPSGFSAFGVSAVGIANGNQPVTTMAVAFFHTPPSHEEIGTATYENIMGIPIALLPSDPWNGAWLVSDSRFVVNGGRLELRSDQHLTVADDDGLVVDILTDETIPRLVARVAIAVVANAHPWHKPSTPQDVDGDGHIIALDALMIINQLHFNQGNPDSHLGARPYARPIYIDVNGDGHLTAADALAVINWLHANPPSPFGEGESASATSNDDSLILMSADNAENSLAPSAALPGLEAESPAPLADTWTKSIATDWVYLLMEEETSTTRSRRTGGGVSSSEASWWPNADLSDDPGAA